MTIGERISSVTHAIGQTPDRILDWLGRAPTTNIRILVTCGCVIITTLRYVLTPSHCANGACVPSWEPSVEWLGFMIAMAGVDSLHFFGKRKTSMEYVAATQGKPAEETE